MLSGRPEAGRWSRRVEPSDGFLVTARRLLPTRFANLDGYWEPFLGDRLLPIPAQADGSIHLTARAWAVQGTVAK